MDDSTQRPPWSASPSAKTRNAAGRSVTALLDELAPEKVLRRLESFRGPIDQHRTPNGCVLQAADCALSVSWFPEQTSDAALGELHVVVWRGMVTRRGAPKPKKGATTVSDLIVKPIQSPSDDCLWQGPDGEQYSTMTLAAKCLALLQEQIETVQQ